jgi:two-component system, OmpR family, response regulator VicR
MKILIVEDDTMTRKAIEHRIVKDGYEVLLAVDGKQAIEILKTNTIDLLLTDLHMPHITGLDLIKYVRTEMKANIPIIMLTRVGLEETVLQAFELGADDYMTKPFKPDELSIRIKKALMRSGI